jgi:hypothetical protein
MTNGFSCKRPLTNGKPVLGPFLPCDMFELLEPFDEPTLEEVVRETGIVLSHDDDNGGCYG